MTAKVVSFINMKGGVGKSTLSMMVAEFLFFRFHKRVLSIKFAGSILNKVMYYRKSHATEAPRLYGARVGNMPTFPRDRYNAFHWWIPDSERIRKLGDYENDELDVGPEKFGILSNKYETGGRLTNNPVSYLSRHEVEGPTYTLSPRLERVVAELAERIGLPL